ncbi:MAG: hypothetical protein WAS90_09590 [Brachymonas denitrificans]
MTNNTSHKCLRLVAAGFVLLASQLAWAQAQVTKAVGDMLNRAYSGYSAKGRCWIGVHPEAGRYCMQIDRIDYLTVEGVQRTYVLLHGIKVNERDGSDGAHVDVGMAGAFVAVQSSAGTEILAGNAMVAVGSSGQAPKNWKFVKLGPDNYWGWLNQWGDCHQGYCGSRASILAPYGKSIRDLAGFAVEYSNQGACNDKACEKSADNWSSVLEIDSAQVDQRVFPLQLTLSGKRDGKPVIPRTWSFGFNPKSWRYVEPKGWPLRGVDF